MRDKTNASSARGFRAAAVVTQVDPAGPDRPEAAPGRPGTAFAMRGRGDSTGSGAVTRQKSLRSPRHKPPVRPELHEPEERGVACWFGATCAGVLLERMRLHLGTQRFLAARRGVGAGATWGDH